MPRINLLPWREEQRARRQRELGIAAVLAVVGGLMVVFACMQYWQGMITHQNQRNALLRAQIAELDRQIAEISGLEEQKDRLLARMEVIESLQRSRPEIVHVFDELARRLPDGTHFTQVRQSNRRIELRGDAQSSTRVSELMRRLDASAWFTSPNLQVVETRRDGTNQRASFTVHVTQVLALDAAEGEEGEGS